MANIDKLNKLALGKSKWLEEAKERKEKKAWLNYSHGIAIKVLKALRDKKMKQKDLAEILGVSPQQVNKIVKGRENLTLETITNLERVLEVSLMPTVKETTKVFFNNVEKYIYLRVYKTKKEIAVKKSNYQLGEESYDFQVVAEKSLAYGY